MPKTSRFGTTRQQNISHTHAHTHTRARAHAHTHTHTHTRVRARTHAPAISLSLSLSLSLSRSRSRSLTHPPTHSLTHSFTLSLSHLLLAETLLKASLPSGKFPLSLSANFFCCVNFGFRLSWSTPVYKLVTHQ